MSFAVLGLTLSMIGKVILGIAVLMVHHKMEEEHRIDKKVIKAMHKEKALTYCAIACIVAGYLIEVRTIHLFA